MIPASENSVRLRENSNLSAGNSVDLIESALRGLLVENRLEFLAGKYQNIDTSHDTLAKHKEVPAIVGHFADKADPTPKKKYTDHILRWYSKGHIRQEDHPRIHKALKGFETNRTSLDVKDIGQYKTFNDLENAVSSFAPEHKVHTPWTKTTKAQRASVNTGAPLIHDDDSHSVRRVDTHEAMRVLGSNTKWCVAPKDSDEVFDSYRDAGPLFHVHDKKSGDRFLVHDESEQYMNVDDVGVDMGGLEDNYPGLHKRHDHGDFEYDPDSHTAADLHAVAGDNNVHSRRKLSHALKLYSHKEDMSGVYRKLAKDSDPWVRANVADSYKAPHDVIHSLSSDPSHMIRRSITRNPSVHPDTLHKMMTDEHKMVPDESLRDIEVLKKGEGEDGVNTSIKKDILRHKNVSAKTLHLGVKDKNLRVRRAALSNPKITPEMMRIAGEFDSSWHRDHVQGREVSKENRKHFYRLTHDIHSTIAAHEKTPESMLRELSHEKYTKSEEVGRSLAENPRTPDDVLHGLGSHKDHFVKYHVAKNRRTRPDTLTAMAGEVTLGERDYMSLEGALVGNPNMPSEGLAKLHSKIRPEAVKHSLAPLIAGHENADSDLLHKIHGSVDYKVRRAVAEHGNTLADTLHNLSGDTEFGIRDAVAQNSNTPTETLHNMLDDGTLGVRRSAQKNLKDRGISVQISSEGVNSPDTWPPRA